MAQLVASMSGVVLGGVVEVRISLEASYIALSSDQAVIYYIPLSAQLTNYIPLYICVYTGGSRFKRTPTPSRPMHMCV